MTKHHVAFLACVLSLALGCQNAGKHEIFSTPLAASSPAAPKTEQEAEPAKFSLGRVFRTVAFWQRADEEETVPQEVIELGDTVDAIAARANELNINDPPDVTQQKAQAILDSTQSWERLIAAGKSVGFINDATTNRFNQFIAPIRSEALKLVQTGGNPQTIAALQHLAGGLKTSFDSVSTMLTHGAAAYQQLIQPQ